MSVKLRDLTAAYHDVYNQLDDTDDPERIITALTAINEAIEIKAGNIATFIQSLDAEAQVIKAEEERLSARRKAVENKKARIKDYLQYELESAGMDKIKLPTITISLQANPWAVDITDESLIPNKYYKVIPEQKMLNREQIKKDLTAGEEVTGCLLHRERSVRIR
jgi:hypothetical protein